MSSSIDIYNDTRHLRFIVEIHGEQAYIEYRYYKNDIAYMHTFVPDEFRGKGIASALAVFALNFAKKEKKKIMLYCPFMARYVKEHADDWGELVDPAYHPNFFNPTSN